MESEGQKRDFPPLVLALIGLLEVGKQEDFRSLLSSSAKSYLNIEQSENSEFHKGLKLLENEASVLCGQRSSLLSAPVPQV